MTKGVERTMPDCEGKRLWMLEWCIRNDCQLELEGEVGIGRQAVGVILDEEYPSYHRHDMQTFERIDDNGDVWQPPDAYHKHPCVAVLGHGEEAEAQLYQWLHWFDDNGFKVESVTRPPPHDPISLILHGVTEARMVRKS